MIQPIEPPFPAGGADYTVLGATGFIGSRIAATLRANGECCYTPARGSEEIFSRNLGKVFYCIGLTADYAGRPLDSVNAHILLLARIFAEAKFERLVYLSSTRLYDGQLSGMEDASLLFNPGNPRHLYDLSKAMGESLCLTASGGRAHVARLSCVYDADAGSPGFLSELLLRLKTQREFTLDSSPSISRDYIALDDVVSGLKAILDNDAPGIVNVASGENVTNRQLADCLNQSGCHIEFSGNTKTQRLPVCDISKLKSLNVHPVSVIDYLETFMRYSNGHAAR
jgi:nucleoside-diphosphate-sugar epimerase